VAERAHALAANAAAMIAVMVLYIALLARHGVDTIPEGQVTDHDE
jgi:hypothetical protein